MNKIKKGFTLAEVLITLTILGVVAAIVIPTMMRNNGEVAERNKIKKAIVDFEKLIPNMTIENNLTSIEALKDYANKDNCVKSRTYFKIKQDDTSTLANNCIFQTSNGVWWNITDITRPVISTKGVENLSTADGENSFLLSTTYSDTARAFIVDDLSSSQLTDEEKAQLSKTLVFAKILSSKNNGVDNDSARLTQINQWYNSSCADYNNPAGCKVYMCHNDEQGYYYASSKLCASVDNDEANNIYPDFTNKIKIFDEEGNDIGYFHDDYDCNINDNFCRQQGFGYCKEGDCIAIESFLSQANYSEIEGLSYYDADGYNIRGFNKDGISKDTGTNYNKYGFGADGINKNTGTKFTSDGYDVYGYNSECSDRNGNTISYCINH